MPPIWLTNLGCFGELSFPLNARLLYWFFILELFVIINATQWTACSSRWLEIQFLSLSKLPGCPPRFPPEFARIHSSRIILQQRLSGRRIGKESWCCFSSFCVFAGLFFQFQTFQAGTFQPRVLQYSWPKTMQPGFSRKMNRAFYFCNLVFYVFHGGTFMMKLSSFWWSKAVASNQFIRDADSLKRTAFFRSLSWRTSPWNAHRTLEIDGTLEN